MATAKLLSATYDLTRIMAAGAKVTETFSDPNPANCSVETNRSDVVTEAPPATVDTCLRADVDLSRQCYGLHTSEQLRYWLVLNELRRETGHQGFTQQQLSVTLAKYGIKNVAAHFKRVLWRGVGLFWNLHDCMVYPIGYVDLAQRIQRKAALAGLHDLYIENPAGAHRDMYLDVSGALDDFEGQILAGWYAMRGNPTISRFALECLFNTDSRTLRRLEKRAGIHIQYNEAETRDPSDVPLGTDGDLRADVWRTKERGFTVWHWRLPNTYHSTIIRQHPRKGQGRKAFYTAKQWIENRLANDRGILVGKLNRPNLSYCETDKAAKRQARRGNGKRLMLMDRPGERGIVWRVYKPLC